MGIFLTIITITFFAHCTGRLISMQWCCCMGGNVGECRSLTFFRVSHYVYCKF